MIPVSIESLVVGFMPMPSVVTLHRSDEEGHSASGQVLPIYVGLTEASAIAAAIDGRSIKRPLTHETALSIAKALGGTVSRVVIDRVEDTTFFATIYIRCKDGFFTRIDARPSDAIALAIRAKAPLFVEEDVMQAASITRAFERGADKQIEMEEFHRFIENVKPEDFVESGTSPAL